MNSLGLAHCARSLALAAAMVSFTTATAAADSLEMPRFGAPRIVGMDSQYSAWAVGVVAGEGSSWIIDDLHASYVNTSNDGIGWETRTYGFEDADEDVCRAASATDGAGNFVTVGLGFGRADPLFTRSQDGGRTWTAPALLASAADWNGLFDCGRTGADIGGTPSGTWVAAWGYHYWDAWGITYTTIVSSRSTDGGATWSKSQIVAFNQGKGAGGLDIETDGHGTWVLMWMDDSLELARSTDDGRTWSAPQNLQSGLGVQERWPNSYVSLATDGQGSWVGVFVASYAPGDLASRVLVLRSGDGGATWLSPQPLEASDSVHGSTAHGDSGPSIATDRTGRWLAAWVRNSGDVVVAMSTDAGGTWGETQVVAAAAAAINLAPALAYGSHGWMLAWSTSDMGVMFAAADATCGNGQIEIAEVCDDGNTADDDGCDSNCTPTGCGNGVVNDGEECDDGDTLDDYCPADCGYLHCGDGIVDLRWEECDDGNDIQTDGCTTACTYGRCGDGFVEENVEQCDPPDEEKCNPECRLATCGDGYLQDWYESCDDGNTIDGDPCPNDCSKATCGDGQSAFLVEECDWADPAWANQCTKACQTTDLCGDVDGDGSLTIADPLRILRSAVGLPVECPHNLCDINRDGNITVTDAQRALTRVVGLEPAKTCSIGTGSIVFWMEDRRSIGALQLDIDYRFTGGEFTGSWDRVVCEPVDAPRAIAFNDDDVLGHRVLRVGMLGLTGFSGPLDLFRCDFELPADRSDARFAIYVTDGTDADCQTLDPPPLIGYRLEQLQASTRGN